MVNHRALALMNPRPAARPRTGDGLLGRCSSPPGVAAWSLSPPPSSSEKDDDPMDPPGRPPFGPVDWSGSPGSPEDDLTVGAFDPEAEAET
jgi:hypothetical protein